METLSTFTNLVEQALVDRQATFDVDSINRMRSV